MPHDDTQARQSQDVLVCEMTEDLVALAEASEITGYNRRTMRQYCVDGVATAVMINCRWYLSRNEVERLRKRKALGDKTAAGCWNKTARELAREAKTRKWSAAMVRRAYIAGEFAQERSGCITMASEDPSVLRVVRRVFGEDVSPVVAGIIEPTPGCRFAMLCDPNNPTKAKFKMIEEKA